MGRKVECIDIVIQHHKYALKIRTQDVILQSPLFSITWEKATDDERKEVLGYIHKIDIGKLKQWLKGKEPTVRELRSLASNNHIKNYSRLSKIQLIDTLKGKVLDE